MTRDDIKNWLIDAASGKQLRTLLLVTNRAERDRVFVETACEADEANVPAMFNRSESLVKAGTQGVLYVLPAHLNIAEQTRGMWFTEVRGLDELDRFATDGASSVSVDNIGSALRSRVRSV